MEIKKMFEKWFKATIVDVKSKKSEKAGQYISLDFEFQDGQQKRKGVKNFFVNHENKDYSTKAKQCLYAMIHKKINSDTATAQMLKNSECFITVKETDSYVNVINVLFTI